MTDLRPFLPVLYEIYSQQMQVGTSKSYTQIQIAGAESFEIQFQSGRFAHARTWSDLTLTMCYAEKKKNTWHAATEIAADLTPLTHWHQVCKRLETRISPQDDPRPAFTDNPKIDVMPQTLLRYDPQVASELPALVFHRAFQTFQPLLKSGLLMDAVCTWHHGGRAWDQQPLPFAWSDSNGFCFLPQTRMDEAIAIYAPDAPRKRRYLASSWDQFSDMWNMDLWLSGFQAGIQQHWIDWDIRHFDRIILMPQVVARVVMWLLKTLQNNPIFLQNREHLLDSRLELSDDPAHLAFQLQGLITRDGCIRQNTPIITDGHLTAFVKKQNSTTFYCPVLRNKVLDESPAAVTSPSSDVDTHSPQSSFPQSSLENTPELSPWIAENISKQRAGKLLCIEHAQILNPDSPRPQLYLPTGAVLCRDGQCLGHVVPPPYPLDMLNLLQNAVAITDPIRIGGIAACGVENEPSKLH